MAVKTLFAMPGQNIAMSQPEKVIIEFYQIGKFVKVSAIDPASMTEASIVGDPAAGETALKRAALQKLKYVMERRGGNQSTRPGRASSTR